MTTDIFELFIANRNEYKAVEMSSYMRNLFPFLGISSPLRKDICKDFFVEIKKQNKIDWEFVNHCWLKQEREFQYLALDYLKILKKNLNPYDIDNLKHLAITKSWWDTIDNLDRLIGSIALNYPEINKTLINWSLDNNFWLRRIAIDHQLLRKEKTNTYLLEQIIVNNFNQSEFFINKAIGWALRDYSKTNPDWVRNFLLKYENQLHKLSKREASKYIG